jgi:HAD superfamily phosphoserine phosphatase-like hydrolase
MTLKNNTNNKAAFLDFDGTLSKSNLSIEFIGYLGGINFFSENIIKGVVDISTKHKNGEMSYDKFCEEWGKLWAAGSEGKSVDEMQQHAKEFFMQFKPNIYASSYALINLLRKEGYRSIILSVGAEEVNKFAANALVVDEMYCTKLEINNSRYTGNIGTMLHLPTGKANILDKLKDRFNFSESLAFGDAISDKRMLELVGIPVALNPSSDLKRLAEEKTWHILNHQNVVENVAKLIRK